MTVFVDFIYGRSCPACHSCEHYISIIRGRFPHVIVRYIDIQRHDITEFYKRNLVIDVRTARMKEDRKKALLSAGRDKLMGTPTIIAWTDKYPQRAFIVKYGCVGRNTSLAEQEQSWKNFMKKVAMLVDLEDGLVGNITDIVFEDMGWVKW